MIKLNNYEAPEIIILELSAEDVITTSIGDTGIPDMDW